MPTERTLTPDEQEGLRELLDEAQTILGPTVNYDDSDSVVATIKAVIEQLRRKQVDESTANDYAFPLGYLYGEQLCKEKNWYWGHVTQDNGFQSYCVISPDKAYICYSIKDVYDFLLDSNKENSSRLLFNMIKDGNLPAAQPGRYTCLSF